jgi:hypothetical protein
LGVALSLSFFLLSRLSEKEQGSPTTIIVVSTVQFRERNKKPRNTKGTIFSTCGQEKLAKKMYVLVLVRDFTPNAIKFWYWPAMHCYRSLHLPCHDS